MEQVVMTEIVYRDENGKLVNKVFESFEQPYPLIKMLDQQNAHYDWYELRGGRWIEVSEGAA